MRSRILALPVVLALAAPAVSAPKAALPVVTKQVLKQRDPGGKWQFSYDYPKISVPGALMGVNGICQDFNRKMEQEARHSQEGFEAGVAANPPVAGMPKAKSELTVTYQVVTRTPGLLAFKFTEFQYLVGQAHPSTTLTTRNFAMQGRFLKLEDLFTPNSGYLEKISASVGKTLKAQAAKKKFEIIAPEGYGPKADNFRAFLVTRGGLTLLFNPAEVAASYVGPLSATVPWSALESSLSTQGKQIRTAVR